MPLLACLLLAHAGATFGLLLAGAWHGTAIAAGLPPPSPDQVAGLVELGAIGGLLAGGSLLLELAWRAGPP